MLFILEIKLNPQMNYAGDMLSYWTLKQVVHKVTTTL
jgi:hypothetical protein